MNTQATQKRTLALKSDVNSGAGELPPPASESLQLPPDMVAKDGSKYLVSVILAVIAAVCFIALLILQWMEFSLLQYV